MLCPNDMNQTFITPFLTHGLFADSPTTSSNNSKTNTTMIRPLVSKCKPEKCNVCVANQDYCNSNWLPYNNLNAGLRGIDLPLKSPFPLPVKADPSSRNLIFNSVERNNDFSNMEQLSYISITDSLKCDTEFDEQSWTTLEKYIRGASFSSLASWNLDFESPKTSFFGSSPITIPPNTFGFKAGSQNTETNEDLENFFTKEHGSISRSSARCSVYRMEVDINDPNLQLSSSFKSAIINLEAVLNQYEEVVTSNGLRYQFINNDDDDKYLLNYKSVTDALMTFIETYGTHYAKSTIMGIGVYFETRYTETETNINNEEVRNKCSSRSGGISLLGFKYDSDNKKCEGNLDDTTKGEDTRLKRFISNTYGTLPGGSSSKSSCNFLTEWSEMVEKMYDEGTLQPNPTQQELAPIYDIFETEAVKKITKNSHSLQRLQKAVQDGFANYDFFFAKNANYDFACAQTIRLGKVLYHRNKNSVTVQDRTIYSDELGINYLYRHVSTQAYFRYWAVSPVENSLSFTRERLQDMVMSTATCPVRAAKFQNPDLIYPYLTGIKSWTDCALQCAKETKCQYWEYFGPSKNKWESRKSWLCGLARNYESIISLPSK